MDLAKPYVVIVLVLAALCFETDGQKACSCYTFEGGAIGRKSWPEAKTSCEGQKKHLVAMETEREWEFIKNETQNRTAQYRNEWLIGLFRDPKNAKWTWVSGQPLTIDKWQKNEPDDLDLYGLIAKDFPQNTSGLFGGTTEILFREWICEEETDNCTGTCLYHNLVPTTATLTRRATTAETERTSSATQDHTDESEPTSSGVETTPEKRTNGKSDSTAVIVAVSLGAVLFIALIVLAVVFFLKRKKRHPQDAERSKKKSSDQPENAYESIDQAEAANLLGAPNSNSVPQLNEQPEYAMVNKKDKRKQNKEEAPPAAPTTDCEYAVVNKENRKKKEGDLVYAQLDMGEIDNAEVDAKVHKAAPYEPTVYADVMQSDVIKGSDPDSTQPTYENIQTTGV